MTDAELNAITDEAVEVDDNSDARIECPEYHMANDEIELLHRAGEKFYGWFADRVVDALYIDNEADAAMYIADAANKILACARRALGE